jgi:hypothetical protein
MELCCLRALLSQWLPKGGGAPEKMVFVWRGFESAVAQSRQLCLLCMLLSDMCLRRVGNEVKQAKFSEKKIRG